MAIERARSSTRAVRVAILGALLFDGLACNGGTLGSGGTGGQSGGQAGSAVAGASGSAGGHRGGRGGIGYLNCWSYLDCPPALGGSLCVPPDNPLTGCAACNPAFPGCGNDSDCASDAGGLAGETLICLPTTCGCSMGICVLGCTPDAGCTEGLVCSSTHRCVAPPCDASTGTGCPDDFTCGANGQCARKSCVTDSDCAVTCVNGSCYSQAGLCSITVA
jgi:hypothetical protein